jgi:hypothetical protein
MIGILSGALALPEPLSLSLSSHIRIDAAVQKISYCAAAMQRLHAISHCFVAIDRGFGNILHRNKEQQPRKLPGFVLTNAALDNAPGFVWSD